MHPLEIKGLKYKNIIKGIDLEVKKGEVFGFIGPNGAGKTTTIKLIMGFLKPSQGDIRIFGKDNSDKNIKLKIGYMPEKPHLYENMTGMDFLKFNLMLYGDYVGEDYWERIKELSEHLEINYLDKRIGTYSKGMLQRFTLLQSLAHDPDLIILDEPMSGLDPIGRKLVRELILSLKEKGKTLFFSTHILPDIEALCDRAGIIIKGELVHTLEATSSSEIEKIFMEYVDRMGVKEIY